MESAYQVMMTTNVRKNFNDLIGKVLVANIPCLKFLGDVITSHIPHKYSKEMANKTNTVSIYIHIFIFSRLHKEYYCTMIKACTVA